MGWIFVLSPFKDYLTEKTTMRMLTARWATDGNSTLEPPSLIWWADGTPATQDEYQKHLSDTHTWVITPLMSIERRVYPEIVADVWYCDATGSWVTSGQGVTAGSLELADRDTTDDQIRAELYTFPVIYRARIHR
jgi:hypothetical protein